MSQWTGRDRGVRGPRGERLRRRGGPNAPTSCTGRPDRRRRTAKGRPAQPSARCSVACARPVWPRRRGSPSPNASPPWVRVPVRIGSDYRRSGATIHDLGLVTVCEEAGCPNIYECWADGTATFMINGERCTRACGFCQVDTRHPLPAVARRARSGGACRGAHGPGARGGDLRGPRRPGRRRRGRHGRHHPGHPGAHPWHCGGGADLRLPW